MTSLIKRLRWMFFRPALPRGAFIVDSHSNAWRA
jgi:hypothetical protein